jgi:hypothetical protein
MNRWSRILAASVIALAIALPSLAAPSVTGRPPAAPIARGGDSIGGTVKLLDTEKRKIEVIVGVGHALRIVRMTLSESCGASVGGRPIPLDGIHPGDIVRVHYEAPSGEHAASAGNTATMIELILAVPGRGSR